MPTDTPDSAANLLPQIEQEGRRWRGAHPTLERLAAYRAGRLPDVEVGPLQQHLVLCANCQRRLLDYAAFDDDLAAQAESGGGALGAAPPGAWQALSARLAADGVAAAPGAGAPVALAAVGSGVSGQPAPPAAFAPRARRDPADALAHYRNAVFALAAALIVCCVALPVWLGGRSRGAEPFAASGPGWELTRGSEKQIDVRLNPQGFAAAFLPVPPERPLATYRIEVTRRSGGLALTFKAQPIPFAGAAGGAAVPGQPAPEQWLAVSVNALSPGQYEARVYLEDGGPGELVAGYALRVIP
jgi:hypothetical protein